MGWTLHLKKENTNGPDAVHRLHDQGIEVIMMTGDAQAVANAVAEDLRIDTVFAEVLPEQKASRIQEVHRRNIHP